MYYLVTFDAEYPTDKHGKLVGWVDTYIDEWPVDDGEIVIFMDPALPRLFKRGRLVEKFENGPNSTFYVRADEIKE